MITKRTITSIWCSFFKDGIDLHAIGKINYIGGKWEWGVYDANYYDFIRAYKNGQEEVIDYLKTQGTSETFKGSDEEYRNKLATFIDQYKYIGTANLLKAPFVLRKIVDKLYTQDYETATEDNSDKLAEEISSHIIHDELNPKLWNEDNTLKPEVKDKITAIVKEFTDYLERDEIKFNIVDIRLVGSNCSYNYNDSSDLDIHIVMDTDSLQCPDNLYPLLYSAYRSLFNGKMDIEFYGIPVELYIETSDTEQQDDVIAEARNQSAVRSTGIYSVLQDKWIKEPVAEAIPEVDEEEFNKIWTKWETEYNNIIKSIPESTECLKQAENDQFEDSDLTEPDILNDEGKVSYQKVLDLDLEEEPILKLNEEAVYGLFLTEIDPKTGKKISSEWDNKGPIEKGTKAEMTALKPKYEDNLNVNRYGRVYKCVVRFIGNTSFEEDLLESLENTVTKYTDEHEIHKSIDNLIEDEWQAISGYQEVIDTLKKLKGKDYSVIKVLQDISDEEQVHVGELQKCLSQVDHDVLDTIDQGEAEATEILDKDTDDLDEAFYEESDDEDTPIEVTDDLYEVKNQFNKWSFRCCYDIKNNIVGLCEIDLRIHDDIDNVMNKYYSKEFLYRFLTFNKRNWDKKDLDEEIDYYGIPLEQYEYENFYLIWVVENNVSFKDTKLYEVLGKTINEKDFEKGIDDLDESLKNITVYHGSSTNISKFSFPIQWFSTSIKYATQFATWVGKNHYLYTCKIAPKNILELGNTDGPVYTLLPLKPYKFSPEFKQIIDNLGISEDEARAIVSKVAGDPHREYTCKIHWITRDIDFCKVVKSKGYDCMKATEAGATTYGVLDPEIVTIVDKKVISDSKEYNEDIDSKIDYDVLKELKSNIYKVIRRYWETVFSDEWFYEDSFSLEQSSYDKNLLIVNFKSRKEAYFKRDSEFENFKASLKTIPNLKLKKIHKKLVNVRFYDNAQFIRVDQITFQYTGQITDSSITESNEIKITGKEDTKIMKLNGKEVEVPIWNYEKVESQDSLKEELTGLEISWEDAIKDSYDFLVSSSGQIPTASQVLEDVVDNYDLDIDIDIELDDPIKYNEWLSDVEHVLNTLGLEVEEESINEELNDYWVISDGKDPRRSSIYSSIDNLDKFIAQLEANKEDKGYWELLHYVDGKDTKVWDTENGKAKTESLKEETEQYKVIKTNSWYDPEGLDIPSKIETLFTGDAKSCYDFFYKTREELEKKYADRNDISVSGIKERRELDHLEKVGPFGYKQIWKEGPGIQYFEVYFRSAISKDYYSVVKANSDQTKQESLEEDYKKDKLWLVEKILAHTVRRAYLTKEGEFEVFSSVEDPTIKDKCELFTYDEAIAKKKEIQDKYPNDIIWVWYSGDVQIDPDKTKTTVVYNGKEYNED